MNKVKYIALKHLHDCIYIQKATVVEALCEIINFQQNHLKHDKHLSIFPIYNEQFSFSGYNFWQEATLVAQYKIAVLNGGGLAIYRYYIDENHQVFQRYDIYNGHGLFLRSQHNFNEPTYQFEHTLYESDNPFIDHFYNILALQYGLAQIGNSNTLLVYQIQKWMQEIESKTNLTFGYHQIDKDPIWSEYKKKLVWAEKDDILNWQERKEVKAKIQQVRQRVLQTKVRTHKTAFWKYTFFIKLSFIKLSFFLFSLRPLDNFRGLLHRHTIGHILWFYDKVKNYIGLSIAMALYTPFTFYFITQPMNPHAMWAVGKVRNAYLNTMERIEENINNFWSAPSENNKPSSPGEQAQSIKSSLAAPLRSDYIQGQWDQSMDDFKAMQIAYEKNLIQAQRFGRTEQIESQFVYSLSINTLWEQILNYKKIINERLKKPEIGSKEKIFLQNEIVRARRDLRYIYFQEYSFLMDHIYIVLDKEREQPLSNMFIRPLIQQYWDHYQQLKDKDLPRLPKSFASKTYLQDLGKTHSWKQLSENPFLFKKEKLLSSEDYRKQLKRHWETLFLQQNKKQEAASFGLQTYYRDSIKNLVWALQGIYNIKLAQLNDNFKGARISRLKEQSFRYIEFILHEYLGIKKEIEGPLKNKHEITRRQNLIQRLENYTTEREGVLNSSSSEKL